MMKTAFRSVWMRLCFLQQHDPEVTQERIHEDIKKYVFDEVIPANMTDDETKFFINPTGRFVIEKGHSWRQRFDRT